MSCAMSTPTCPIAKRLLWPRGAAPQALMGLGCDPDSSILLAAMWLMSQTIVISLQPWHPRGYGVYPMAALSLNRIESHG